MTVIDTTLTVGQLVADRPARSRVFEKLGIDFCCGGKKPLDEACRERGLDSLAVAHALAEADNAQHAAGAVDAANMTLTQLCDHIEQTHHAYLHAELPRLGAMVHKVASVHGDRHPWTRDIHNVFAGLAAEMDEHMLKEEQVLFPWIRAMEENSGALPGHCGGSIGNPIHVMEHEHDNAGRALARLNALSDNYTAPPDACNTFLAMLDGLRQLETDMHQHVHKENNMLFPKALALEGRA